MKNLLIGSAILALMSGTAFADTYVLAMKGPGAGNPFGLQLKQEPWPKAPNYVLKLLF